MSSTHGVVTSAARRSLARSIHACSRRIGSVVAVGTRAAEVVLTYDDGPCPVGTTQVLDALAERGATATFFVLLTRARRYPAILADVAAAGHEVALHGLDHRRLAGFTPAEVERRTRDGRAELEDMLSRRVRWFRPPYGKQTLRQWRRVTRCGLVPVSWGGDMADWRTISQSERVAHALRVATPGAILLGHDGFAGPLDGTADGPAPTVDRGELARRVLDAYGDCGLRGRSLGTALTHGVEIRRAWFS